MPREYITDAKWPEARDGFMRENLTSGFSFTDPDAQTETDLLPDEDFISEINPRKKSGYDYDVAIIGSGPAGISAAVKASGLGARVIMFEKEALGGLWLNAGCIPTITYLTFGRDTKEFKNLISHKNNIVSKLTSGTARTLRACRVRIEAGEAVIKSPNEIACKGRTYTTSKIILCSGSSVDRSQIPGAYHKNVYTYTEIYKMQEVPKRLMVLGANSDGCTIALVFAALGSNVMLVEPQAQILPGWDKQVASAAAKALSDAGVKLHTGITVREIGDKDGNPFVITDRGGVLCEKVLLSTARKPDISALGELIDDIELDGGVITVNEFMETSHPGIFAAGDITGLDLQTQAACKMAEIAAANAMGNRVAFDIKAVPMIMHTTPEAASVGLTEEEALELYGDDLLIGESPMSSNVRAILSGKTDGFVKVLADRRYGEILGVHIVASEAAEMINEPSAMMQMEITIHEVADEILHAHPTYGEAFANACASAVAKKKT